MVCLCPQNVQTVSTVLDVLRRVVHTVVVTDCVTRSQVIVSVDVTVVTMAKSVEKVCHIYTVEVYVSLSMCV